MFFKPNVTTIRSLLEVKCCYAVGRARTDCKAFPLIVHCSCLLSHVADIRNKASPVLHPTCPPEVNSSSSRSSITKVTLAAIFVFIVNIGKGVDYGGDMSPPLFKIRILSPPLLKM